MSEKLCLFCKSFAIEAGCADTMGYGGDDFMSCKKDIQCFPIYSDKEDSFREHMLFAGKCPAYEQVKP